MHNSYLQRMIILLFLGFKLSKANLNLLNCSYYRGDENFYVKQSNGIIIQNDQLKIDQIGYELFKKSFVMQSFSLGQIKSILFMNSINFNVELIYCFCQLLDNFPNQNIICIDGIEIDLKTHQYRKHKNAQITNIQIKIENGYCDQILSDNRNHIKAYCKNSTSVILNYINLQDSSSFQIIGNELLNEQNCLTKFFTFQQEEYLSYYNCSNWRIYLIDKNEMEFQLILNQELFSNYFDHYIKILNDIENCQDNLYLIESNFYLSIKKHPEGFQLFDQKNLSNQIFKIFIDDHCKIELIVTQNIVNESIIFNKDEFEISIQQNFKTIEIFYNKQILLIKRQNELQLIFSEFLKETYTLKENPLISMKSNGLKSTQLMIESFYYQIEIKSNQVFFYRLLQLKKYFKPSKQYLFQINNLYIFTPLSIIQGQCYQILQDKNYRHQIVQNFQYDQLKTNNYCDSIHEFNFAKNFFDNSINFKLDVFSLKNQQQIDINDDFNFKKICKNFDFSDIEKIIWVSQGNPILISFIIKNILYFYDCSVNFIFYQMNVKDKTIFVLNDAFIIWKFNENFINLLNIFDQTSKLVIIPFEQQIKNIITGEIHLIIQFQNESLIFSIYTQRQIQLNEKLKQYGQPIYYFERNSNYQLIQFNDCLAIKSKNSSQFTIIQFINKKITKILDNSNIISIQSIHKEENLIQTFVYDGLDLILAEQFLITDSQIHQSLILGQSQYFTVLVTTTNDDNNLNLFYTYYLLKRIDIKPTKKLSFYINNQYLYYFDNKSNLRYKDLFDFKIILETPSDQMNAFDIYEIQLRFTINYDKQIQQIFKPFKLILKNECYKITPKKSQIQILQSSFKNILQINQLFFGPIDRISIDNKNILIQYPFEEDKQKYILMCQQQFDQFCVFRFENESEFLNLNCLIQSQENGQIIVEFCRAQQCFSQFYIKNMQKLVCFINNNEIELEIIIFVFIVKQQQVKVDQLPTLKFYDNFQDLSKIIIIKCQLLFIIINKNLWGTTKNYFFHLQMSNLNYEKLALFNIEQAIYIGNKKNYYLIVVSEIDFNINKYSSYKFVISYLEDEKFIISNQFNFDQTSLVFQLYKNKFVLENNIYIKQLSSCEFIGNQLITYLLTQVHGFILEVQLKYNFITQQQNYQVEKLIRHPNQNVELSIHYYDQKILILTNYINLYYLYDLTQDFSMYDHIYKSQTLPNLIFEFNTTHFLIFDQYNTSISIEEIGYKIILQNHNISNEEDFINFTLKVENNVFESSILFIIDNEELLQRTSLTRWLIIIFISITFVIFLVLIFITIQRYKKRNHKNQSVQSSVTSVELF